MNSTFKGLNTVQRNTLKPNISNFDEDKPTEYNVLKFE